MIFVKKMIVSVFYYTLQCIFKPIEIQFYLLVHLRNLEFYKNSLTDYILKFPYLFSDSFFGYYIIK